MRLSCILPQLCDCGSVCTGNPLGGKAIKLYPLFRKDNVFPKFHEEKEEGVSKYNLVFYAHSIVTDISGREEGENKRKTKTKVKTKKEFE